MGSLENLSLLICSLTIKIFKMSLLSKTFIFFLVVFIGIQVEVDGGDIKCYKGAKLYDASDLANTDLAECSPNTAVACKWTKANAGEKWKAGTAITDSCVAAVAYKECAYGSDGNAPTFAYPVTFSCKPPSDHKELGCKPTGNKCPPPGSTPSTLKCKIKGQDDPVPCGKGKNACKYTRKSKSDPWKLEDKIEKVCFKDDDVKDAAKTKCADDKTYLCLADADGCGPPEDTECKDGAPGIKPGENSATPVGPFASPLIIALTTIVLLLNGRI